MEQDIPKWDTPAIPNPHSTSPPLLPTQQTKPPKSAGHSAIKKSHKPSISPSEKKPEISLELKKLSTPSTAESSGTGTSWKNIGTAAFLIISAAILNKLLSFSQNRLSTHQKTENMSQKLCSRPSMLRDYTSECKQSLH